MLISRVDCVGWHIIDSTGLVTDNYAPPFWIELIDPLFRSSDTFSGVADEKLYVGTWLCNITKC